MPWQAKDEVFVAIGGSGVVVLFQPGTWQTGELGRVVASHPGSFMPISAETTSEPVSLRDRAIAVERGSEVVSYSGSVLF